MPARPKWWRRWRPFSALVPDTAAVEPLHASDGRVTLAGVIRYSTLPDAERERIARRLRLEWASSGDREHAAGVERMIESRGRTCRRPA